MTHLVDAIQATSLDPGVTKVSFALSAEEQRHRHLRAVGPSSSGRSVPSS